MKLSVEKWFDAARFILLSALFFMWQWPTGSFNPTHYGFYLSILLAATIYFLVMIHAQFPQQPTDRNLVIVEWIRRVEIVILISLVLMWQAPFGSFDPEDRGFYLSIFLATIIYAIVAVVINKYKRKQ